MFIRLSSVVTFLTEQLRNIKEEPIAITNLGTRKRKVIVILLAASHFFKQ